MVKVLLLICLVVALSWGALAFGVAGEQGDMDRASERAAAWFGGLMTTGLTGADLSPGPDCTRAGAELRVSAGRSCRVTVGRGGLRLRTGRLVQAAGNGTARFLPAPSDDPRPEPAGAKAPPLRLSVHAEGGEIELTCRSGSDCRFRLGAAP